MDDLQRQVRIALIAIITIIPIGILGFMLIEGKDFIDAVYVTIITLSTVGFGDVTPETLLGKIFTLFLVVFGLGAFVFVAQGFVAIIASPALRNARQRRITKQKIAQLSHHYIICGMGEMVDKTVEHLMQSVAANKETLRAASYSMVDYSLDRWLGTNGKRSRAWLRRPLRAVGRLYVRTFRQHLTLLDLAVVVTEDRAFANHLREKGLLVIEGNPANDTALRDAGIDRAQAMMVILDNDTETLLTVLTAHNIVPTLPITAGVLDDELLRKVARVGANAVITPYVTAGQFLNNATLRPAVSHYFTGLLFEHSSEFRIAQLEMRTDSPWIGLSIRDLQLREHHNASAIGIRYEDATYGYAPEDSHVLGEDETLIVVGPPEALAFLKKRCRGAAQRQTRLALWQPLPLRQVGLKGGTTYTLESAEEAIKSLSKHFVICGDDRVARSAIDRLDPARPFVIISHDEAMTEELLERGFRVVHGNPTQEETLTKAGVQRAQAIMVALESKADSVLTILSSRTLNKRLLITATANTDDMIDKLERAGADRVVSPFHVAAQYILLTTMRPEIAAFVDYVLYNYVTGLETTEIYMEDDSLWIGRQISELRLRKQYNAGVIGVRQADRKSFVYAPPNTYVIRAHEVLIIVTPMQHSDEIRDSAHGGTTRAPSTLRNRVLQSARWTPEQIQEMLKQGRRSS